MRSLQRIVKELNFSPRLDITTFDKLIFKLGVNVTKAIRFNESSRAILPLVVRKSDGQITTPSNHFIHILVLPDIQPTAEQRFSNIEEAEILIAEMSEGKLTKRLFRKMINVICKSFVISDLDNVQQTTTLTDDTYFLQIKDIRFYQSSIEKNSIVTQTISMCFNGITIIIYSSGGG